MCSRNTGDIPDVPTFLCVSGMAHMEASPRFQTPEASGGYQDQAIASSYLAKSLQYRLFQRTRLPISWFRIWFFGNFFMKIPAFLHEKYQERFIDFLFLVFAIKKIAG